MTMTQMMRLLRSRRGLPLSLGIAGQRRGVLRALTVGPEAIRGSSVGCPQRVREISSLRSLATALSSFQTATSSAFGALASRATTVTAWPTTLEPRVREAAGPSMALLRMLADVPLTPRQVSYARRQRHLMTPQTKTKRSGDARTQRNRQLREAIQCGDITRAMPLLEDLLKPSHAHESSRHHAVETSTYNHLLFAFSESQQPPQRHQRRPPIDLGPMLALLEDMVRWRRADARSFNTAIVACHHRRSLETGLQVLELMQRSGQRPGAFAYTNLISCCARLASQHKGRREFFFERAQDLWADMVDEVGVTPTIEVVNAMTFVYRAMGGRGREAETFVEENTAKYGVQPDTRTIHTLIGALVKDGEASKAANWLEHGIRHRIQLDKWMIRSVVDCCRREAAWARVTRLQRILENAGLIQQDRQLANALTRCRFRDTTLHGSTRAETPRRSENSLGKKAQRKESTRALREVVVAIARNQPDVRKIPQPTKAEWATMIRMSDIAVVEKLQELLQTPACYKLLEETNPTISLPWLNTLILRAFGSAGQWQRAIEILDNWTKSSKGAVDIAGFNAVLAACSNGGRVQDAVEVMDRLMLLQSRRLKPNFETYSILLKCAASAGDTDTALSYFVEMERTGIRPTTLCVNSVLKSFAIAAQRLIREGQSMEGGDHGANEGYVTAIADSRVLASRCMRFFNGVSQRGIAPDEATMYHLFRSYLAAADFSSAYNHDDPDNDQEANALQNEISVFVKTTCHEGDVPLISPRVVNVAIDIFQRYCDVESCFELYNTMVTRGIDVTPDTLRLLFGVCGRTEDSQLGSTFVEHLLSASLLKDDRLWQSVSNEALTWVAQSSSTENVDQLLAKFRDHEHVGVDETTFESILSVYGQSGDVRNARYFAQRMFEDLGFLTTAACNRVLQACSVAKSPVAALDAAQWIATLNVSLDVTSFNSILSAIRRGLIQQQQVDSTEESEEMDFEDGQLEPSVVGYKGRGTAHRQESKNDRWHQLEQRLQTVVWKLVEDMDAEDIRPNSQTCEQLVGIFAARDQLSDIIRVFDVAQQHSRVVGDNPLDLFPVTSLYPYADACARLGESSRLHDLSQFLTEYHKCSGDQVDTLTLLRLLQGFEEVGQWRETTALLKEMDEKFGIQPTAVVFHEVMAICNRAGAYKSAVQIFDTMQAPGTYRVQPSAASYIEAIFALEHEENWVRATKLFMEMQKNVPADELPPTLLRKIALGRYSEGRRKPDGE